MYTYGQKKKQQPTNQRQQPQNGAGTLPPIFQSNQLVNQFLSQQNGEKEQSASASARSSINPDLQAAMQRRIERLRGVSLDDVRVHRNSDKPAELGALAYTQGNQVYIGPGQEEHLEHELGHVAQQKAGMVRATGMLNGEPINENPKMEKQASTHDECNIDFIPNPSMQPIIQKQDAFIPNTDEPHLHLHSGGITYTSIGHRHKNIVAGNQVRYAAIKEVIQELANLKNNNNAVEIITYLNDNYQIPEDADALKENMIEEVKSMLHEIGVKESALSYDTAFDEELSNFIPKNWVTRKPDEKINNNEEENFFLRNANYVRRVYDDYYNEFIHSPHTEAIPEIKKNDFDRMGYYKIL